MALALEGGKALVIGDLLATTHAGLLREFDCAFEDFFDFFLNVCVFLQILCFEFFFLLLSPLDGRLMVAEGLGHLIVKTISGILTRVKGLLTG